MQNLDELKSKILRGAMITKDEAMGVAECGVEELSAAADEIRRAFCSDVAHLCTIVNGKGGRCGENCKFCAQSLHYKTGAAERSLIDENAEEAVKSAVSNYQKGVRRFSIVTAGRKLSHGEIDRVCTVYKKIREICPIELCGSFGLLEYEDFLKLKAAGVSRYHNNLETSRNFFPQVCTTHSYDDKIRVIENAKNAGLEICSGGIIGLGETLEDRIDLALTLRSLDVASVPINVLNPIPGTPLENQKVLDYDELRKTAALFRLIFPRTEIRLAGGRPLFSDAGLQTFRGGVNASISGDFLTTSGISAESDVRNLKEMGFRIS